MRVQACADKIAPPPPPARVISLFSEKSLVIVTVEYSFEYSIGNFYSAKQKFIVQHSDN